MFETLGGFKKANYHAEALVFAGALIFVVVSLFTVSSYLGTSLFSGFIVVGLIVCMVGLGLYAFRLVLNHIFRRAFEERNKTTE